MNVVAWCSVRRSVSGLVILLIVGLVTPNALAIAGGTTDTSAFSQLSGPYAGFDWSGVVAWNGSSAVAIGPRHLLTANHVGGSAGNQFTHNGVTYTAVTAMTAPTEPGRNLPPDLRLITLDRDLPSFYSINTTSIASGTSVITVGFGSQGVDHDSYYTAGSGRGVKRWGTNTVTYPALRQTLGDHSSPTFSMKFNSGQTDYESGFTPGDSGGGTFILDDQGDWVLAGINAYTSHNGTAGNFNQSYAISLADQIGWINATMYAVAVPEPASLALLSLGGLAMIRRRKHRS